MLSQKVWARMTNIYIAKFAILDYNMEISVNFVIIFFDRFASWAQGIRHIDITITTSITGFVITIDLNNVVSAHQVILWRRNAKATRAPSVSVVQTIHIPPIIHIINSAIYVQNVATIFMLPIPARRQRIQFAIRAKRNDRDLFLMIIMYRVNTGRRTENKWLFASHIRL